ncbi:hypothetical protein GCM10009795_026330 [Nocardioides hankookensis]|uniref:Uncharacterized protein n=1 Tax=Nocardioides hankookensis TaxID=443157 RepID=A0ABW1LDV3_9ACTN
MSVGVVFSASDGLLVIVDGQMSEKSPDAPNGRKVIETDRRKVAFAPDEAAVVVVLTGQATMCEIEAWRWVEIYLEEVRDDNVSGDLRTPREVARAASRVIGRAVQQDNENRRAKGKHTNDGVDAFVAGFAAAPEDRQAFGEVWVFSSNEEGDHSPRAEPGFGDDTYGRPLGALPERAPFRDPDDDGYGRLPADAIYDRFGATTASLRSMPLREVRELVETTMRDLVQEEATVLLRGGVGGTWTLIELRPGVAPVCDRLEWGP